MATLKSLLVVSILVLAQAISAQTSVNLQSAFLPPNGAPGVNVKVDVSFPGGSTVTLAFELIRAGTVVATTAAVENPGGAAQSFNVLFSVTPKAGDVVRAVVVCSNGQTATSTNTIP